jgi:hypothetical protein
MATISGTVTFTAAELSALAKQVAALIPVGTTPPVVIPPVVTPPPKGALMLYSNGVNGFGGDWSFGNGRVDYASKDIAGLTVIAVIGDEGLQPYYVNQDLDTTGYKYFEFDLWPTQANNAWVFGSEMKGDITLPGAPPPPSIMAYGPNPAIVGQWNHYKVPKSIAAITDATHLAKSMLLEQKSTNKTGNKWYVNNICWTP